MTAGGPGFPDVPGYEVLAVLGRGGFATVYRATQTSVGREVALKVLGGGAIDANAERRFRHEVAAVGALSDHDHVVSVYDVGTTPDGLPFIAMQLVTGGSLADRVRTEGPLPATEVARIGAEVADALEAAHEAGILHRDIKPDNVLVGRRGRSLLTDFGIATLSDATRTATGMITGTLPFTAPEIFQGQRPSPATDVYALGATLYTLAAARMAFFTGEEHAATVMWRIANDPPPPLPESVPGPLAELIDACLAKDAADRPSLADLLARLEALAAPSAPPTPVPTPIPAAAPSPPTPTPGPPPPRQVPGQVVTPPPPPADDAATIVQGAAPHSAETVVQRSGPDAGDAATVVQPDAVPEVGPPPVAGPVAAAPAPPAPPRPTEPRPRRSRKGLLLGALAVLVVLALAAVAAVVVLGGGDDGGGGGGGSGEVASFPVGTSPVAVAVDDTGLWVANRDDATVTHLGFDGTELGTTTVGGSPVAVVAGDSGVWVANRDDSTVSRIDPETGDVPATPSVGDAPARMAINGSFVYVWNEGDMDVNTVDPSIDEYGTDTGLPAFGPSDLAATDDGVAVVTAGDDGTDVLAVFSSDLAEQIFTVELPGAPSGVTATDRGIWVALGGDGTVVRIDPEAGEVVATIEVGGDLRTMTRDGDEVWVGDVEGERVVRLDVDSDEVAEDVSVEAAPEAFAVADGAVWVPVPDEGVVRRVPI